MNEPWPQRLRRWGAAYGFIALSVLAIFLMMDGVTAYRAPRAEAPAATGPAPVQPGRVFILLLDSLRYETAIDPDIMPNLARLRAQATWAAVRSSYNAVTVPSVRTAFTGRDEVTVLGFVRNFVHGNAGIDSLFSRLAARGHRTAAMSNGAFTQFGAAIEPNINTGTTIQSDRIERLDDASVAQMLALFREGRHDVVIVHVSYTDYAAHRYGVGTHNYRRDFRRADRLVALADAAVSATDTLVVMGDHGHDEKGSHTLGLTVPTFLLYRGPAFKAGYNLGLVDIMSHYWLVGSLFGLPLPPGYTGGQYPEALTTGAAANPSREKVESTDTWEVPLSLWVYQAALVLFGAGLIWRAQAPWMRRSEARWLVWLALLPAFCPLPWNGWLGAPVALAIAAWLLRGASARAWGFAAAGLVITLGWHEWGSLLARWHEIVHATTREQWIAGWAVAGGATVLAATRRNRAWFLLPTGIAGFLTLPTSNRYGFTGMMVPLLWLWLAGYLVSLLREGRLRSRADAAWAAGLALAIFGFTQMFAGVEAANYLFRRWVPAVDLPFPGFDWLMTLGALAKLLVLCPNWPRRWLPGLTAAFVVGALQYVQWRLWEPGAGGSLLIGAVLLGGWLALRRRDPELARVLLLALLFFLYAYCVRPVRESYARADCVLAGLLLSARWIRRFPQPENLAIDCLVLGTVAFLATGYFTTQWSIEALEWTRIYTWFPAQLVESAVGASLLVPWLVLKTALPLFIAQLVLAREWGEVAAWPGENLRRLVGGKILTLTLVVTGLGAIGTVNVVYLEGVQELTILAILAVGLLFEPGSRAVASARA